MAQLLAKPDKGLIDHLTEVTQLGDGFSRRLGLPEALRVKILLACALHDIGKATISFQEYINKQRKQAYPHALASLPFVLMVESLLGQHYGWDRQRLEATCAVLTHHSPLGPELYKGYEHVDFALELLPRTLQAIWKLLASWGVSGLPEVDVFWYSIQPMLEGSPAALLEQSFAFNGQKKTLRGILQGLPVQDFARVKAVLHLADWLASAKKPDWEGLFLTRGKSFVQKHIQRFPSPLWDFQQQAGRTRSGILWLRAPTGTGKTEALLLWAGDADRLIYLLPTQATTTAMWRRLEKIYGEERVGLAHGRASYILRKEAEEEPLDARLFGSVFARPVTVATLDQYLIAHLNGRHWEERRTLARQATVVLDEIHAYEPYTLGLLLEALEREHPERLALASATLPESLLEHFPRGKLIEAESVLWERIRHRVELRTGKLLEEGVDLGIQFARQHKRVLVVANTIQDAQVFYQQLGEAGWANRALLHARFIFRDRQKKEEFITQAGPGTIFIATQVVEVSLDISYDVLLTEIAPVDALVQRMGRVNRRGKQPPVPVIVFQELSEGSLRVYGDLLLEKSEQILSKLSPTPTDRELSKATNLLYEQVIPAEAWQSELMEGRRTLDEVQRILGCYTIDLSDEELRQRFTTRRGMLSVEVLPDRFKEEAFAMKERNEGWRLTELLVPVPIWWLKAFPDQFAGISDLRLYITHLPYDPELGLLKPENEQEQPGGIIM